MNKFENINNRVMKMLSAYLNDNSDYVNYEMVGEIISLGISEFEAFQLIMQNAFNLDSSVEGDRIICKEYFPDIFKQLCTSEYTADPYYANIQIPEMKIGKWNLTTQVYQPFEVFVYDDMHMDNDGRLLPRIGYFNERYEYPAVMENGRLWMSITPNEVETMKEPIMNASGKVLTYGLGLGYFAYMASLKDVVESVTIVERDDEVIDMFKRLILPQFTDGKKIRIVQADAFEYADKDMAAEKYDYVFTDLWHDAGDGLELYLKMKKFETRLPDAIFDYWIEKSIKLYL